MLSYSAIEVRGGWPVLAKVTLEPGAKGADVAKLRARLAITLDPEDGPLYQGIVALEAGSVATLLEHYLASSEQLESRLALAVDDGRVGGLLVQRLPGAHDEDAGAWDEAARVVGGASAQDLVAAGHDVFCIDWGTPGDEDRFITFDDVCTIW